MASPLLPLLTFLGKPPDLPAETRARTEFAEGVALLSQPDVRFESQEAAYAHFVAATRLDPSLVNAHYNAGWVAEAQADPALALTHYESAWFLQSEDGEFQRSYAEALLAQDFTEAALEVLRGSVDPDSQQMYLETLLASGQNHRLIREATTRMLDGEPSASLFWALARAWRAIGEEDMAQFCTQKAILLSTDRADLYNNIGVEAVSWGDVETALEAFQAAMDVAPLHHQANLNLGIVMYGMGNFPAAQERFAIAALSDPESLPARLGLAMVLPRTLEFQEAIYVYSEILRDFPDSEKVAESAAIFYARYLEDFKTAKHIISKFNRDNKSHITITEVDELHEKHKSERDYGYGCPGPRFDYREVDRFIASIAELESRLSLPSECVSAETAELLEVGTMLREQGQIAIDADEFAMMADMQTLVDDILQQLASLCGEPPTKSTQAVTPNGAPALAAPQAP